MSQKYNHNIWYIENATTKTSSQNTFQLLLLFSTTHCSLQGLLCNMGQTFQLQPPGVSTREHPAAEGRTVGEKCPGILPKCRLPRYIQGSFTCRKAKTWDRRLYFPSEGRHAEDFFALKIRRLRPGAKLRTRVPKASTLPLDHRSCSYIPIRYNNI